MMLENPKTQRKLVLAIGAIALLLDNMLYAVIVPTIPDHLRKIGAWEAHIEGGEMVTSAPRVVTFTNATGTYTYHKVLPPKLVNGVFAYDEDTFKGFLFASKAIAQMFTSPFSGALVDRMGYDKPMMMGLTVMWLSTAIFSIGFSYSVLFFARCLQGVGAAFVDTSALAMIASVYRKEAERAVAFGIVLAFISLSFLIAPPFAGYLYDWVGKEVPFLIFSVVCLIDGTLLWLVMKPIKKQQKESGLQKPKGTPIWTLFMDPYIVCCSGALLMANVSLAFLEPTISNWVMDTMDWYPSQAEQSIIFLSNFIIHNIGVMITVSLGMHYPQYQYVLAAVGLALEGVCCLMIPFSKSFWELVIPLSGICFGIALIDTALLPTLGYLVDSRHVSVYGSIYAIADISYNFAYAFGPIIAGKVMDTIGFTPLNVVIGVSTLAYVPTLCILRKIHDQPSAMQKGQLVALDYALGDDEAGDDHRDGPDFCVKKN